MARFQDGKLKIDSYSDLTRFIGRALEAYDTENVLGDIFEDGGGVLVVEAYDRFGSTMYYKVDVDIDRERNAGW